MTRVALMALGIVAAVGLISVGEDRVSTQVAGERSAATATSPPPSPTTAIRIAARRTLVCKLRRGASKLPATSRRGLVDHLRQYPVVGLGTPRQRAGAERVLAQLESAAEQGNWSNLQAVARAGYDTRTAPRKAGDRSVHFFHAERGQEPRRFGILNSRRPKALIYANAPGRPLVLVGAMWSTRRGERGPTPAGPIMRWHSHVICSDGRHRGLKPPGNGICPPGTSLRQGRSEMLHVWFTGDLRSAFAIRAPEPELCAADLLPRAHCERPR